MQKTNQKQFKVRIEFERALPEYLEGNNWAAICVKALGYKNDPDGLKRIMIMFPDGSETDLPLNNLTLQRRAGRWLK